MQYMTVKQIAEAQSVTVETVRNWIKAKKLKAVKVGKSYRVTEAAYKQLCEKGL